MRRTLFYAAWLLAVVRPLPAQSWSTDSAAVRATLTDFLSAFENLDWPRFRLAFSDSVTVFHPAPDLPGRFSGRPEVEASFLQVFAGIRASATDGPPFHRLTPESLSIRQLAPGVALVTFILRNSERLGRRTIILSREPGGWHIVHLHASNLVGN